MLTQPEGHAITPQRSKGKKSLTAWLETNGLYSIPATVVLTGLSRRSIYNLISLHRAQLDPPRYRLYQCRLRRYLTGNDIHFIMRAKHRTRPVKEKI